MNFIFLFFTYDGPGIRPLFLYFVIIKEMDNSSDVRRPWEFLITKQQISYSDFR